MGERRLGGQCMSCGSDGHDFKTCPKAPKRPTVRTKPGFSQPPPASTPIIKAKEDEDWDLGSIPLRQPGPGNFSGGMEKGLEGGNNRGQERRIGATTGRGDDRRTDDRRTEERRSDERRGTTERRGRVATDGGEDRDPGAPPRSTYIPELATEEALLAERPSVTGLHFEALEVNDIEYTGPERPSVLEERELSKWGIHPQVMTNTKRMGWLEATPIQRYAFKPIMEKRDVMGCAQTGSGKTGAYLIPVYSALLSRVQTPSLPDHCEPLVLILVPTRELATQIYNQAKSLSIGTVFNTRVLYGGTQPRWAAEQLRNTDVLVATPGRLKHFISDGTVEVRRLKFLILDEADLMLSMGFESDIRGFVTLPDMPCRGQRQTLMFSATFPGEIQRLASDFLLRHIFISVGIVGNANTAISQSFHCLNTQPEKKGKLKWLLQEVLGEPSPGQKLNPLRILVFVERKRMADFLGSYMNEMGFPTATIHGDREQSQREEALRQLRTLHAHVLIATSLAGRGLHIPDIHMVVNYDLPQSIEEYVHRIGRTGRVGHEGLAVSFYVPDFDRVIAQDLLKILQQSNQPVPDFLLKEAEQFIATSAEF